MLRSADVWTPRLDSSSSSSGRALARIVSDYFSQDVSKSPLLLALGAHLPFPSPHCRDDNVPTNTAPAPTCFLTFEPCGWESWQYTQQGRRRGAHGFLCGVRICGFDQPPSSLRFALTRPHALSPSSLPFYSSSTRIPWC